METTFRRARFVDISSSSLYREYREVVGIFDLMGHLTSYSKTSYRNVYRYSMVTCYPRFKWSKSSRRELNMDLKSFRLLADEVAKIKRWEI